ncbi:MAG: HIT family protein [Chloroflexota bacterium]|nr:HIT family protein [Chloroflexota bacterium]
MTRTTDDFYCAEVLSGHTPIVRIRETDDVLAYRHTRPFFKTHFVVVPKRHIASLLDPSLSDGELLALLHVVRDMAAVLVAARGACRITTNLGDYQDSKHLHWHVFSGERKE